MLSAFQLENNRLTRLEVEESQPLVNAVWIDLVEPDDDERLRVQSELGQSLATRPELEDIEASARFFEDDDGLHIHSFFFFEDAEDHAGNSTVAFTIRDGRLFTLRERELPAFRLYRMRARSQSMVDGNAYELLLDLFETKIEQLADEIENIYSDLEQLSKRSPVDDLSSREEPRREPLSFGATVGAVILGLIVTVLLLSFL